jgi:hypothetical protein
MPFVAMHASLVGTFRTSHDFRAESDFGGEAEVGVACQGQLLAQSGRSRACPLLAAERTCHTGGLRSRFDPERTSADL